MASRRPSREFRPESGRSQRPRRPRPVRSSSKSRRPSAPPPRLTEGMVRSPLWSRRRPRATAPRRRGSSVSNGASASNAGAASTGDIDEEKPLRPSMAVHASAATKSRPGVRALMAAVVWFTVAIALWHFTVFVPDRFWAGIVGALLGAIAGGMISGAIVHIASGRSIGDTDFGTVLVAIPGTLIGIAVVYAIGVRRERLAAIE